MWFEQNPKMAWAFYGHRLKLYKQTTPHDGFNLLLELVKSKNNNYFIYTSNVDGQFQKAGFSEDKIYECHGSIHYSQCIHNSTKSIWENIDELSIDMDKFEATNLPICKECGCVTRPNVLMFYDYFFNDSRINDQYERYERWLRKNMNSNIAIIELGAGVAIPTIRKYGEYMAKKFNKIKLIRINPLDDGIKPQYGYSLKMGALEGLQTILT